MLLVTPFDFSRRIAVAQDDGIMHVAEGWAISWYSATASDIWRLIRLKKSVNVFRHIALFI